MTYAVRDYQAAAQAAVREHWASGADTSPMLVIATGGGKTEVGLGLVAEAIRRGERVIWLSHRKELVAEPVSRFVRYFPELRRHAGIVRASDDDGHCAFVSASVQTLLVERRRSALLRHGSFGLLVADECFPAGTLVDGVPIERRVAGDLVWSIDHATGALVRRPVVRVFRREAAASVRIDVGGAILTCTPNHPIFVQGRGYESAISVRVGDVCCLWGALPGEGVGPPGGQALLARVPEGGSVAPDEPHEPGALLRPDEGEQPDAARRGAGEGGVCSQGEWTQATDPGREWTGGARGGGCVEAGEGAGRRLGAAGRYPDRPGRGIGLPAHVQGGSGEPGPASRGGSGRQQPPDALAAGRGSEERGAPRFARVDRVSHDEPGGDERRPVYNLEVEGSHTYFANGILVHNCHHDTSDSHEVVIDAIRARRLLGLTATPHRDDGGDLSRRWEIVYSYDILRAVAEGWLVQPYAAVRHPKRATPAPTADPLGFVEPEGAEDALLAHLVEHTVAELGREQEAVRLPDRDHRTTLRASSALVITTSIRQAEATVRALGRGAVVSGTTQDDERADLLRGFDRGRIPLLASADALREGTDMPRIDTVVIARKMRSWSLAIQSIGRGLRLWHPTLPKHEWNTHNPAYQDGGKMACLLLDLSGATDVHPLSAPPVLIGGSQCEKAPNGLHDFKPQGVGGICVHCERRVACFELLGTHEYRPDGACRACGTLQCPDNDSPAKVHRLIPMVEDDRPFRLCIYCGVRVPDPHGSIGDRPSAEAIAAPRHWVRLFGVEPETWAVDAAPHGMILASTPDRARWTPYWVRSNRIRSPKPFYRDATPDKVDEAAAFILVQSAKAAPPAPRELKAFFRHARERAIVLGIGQRCLRDWSKSPSEPARNLPWRK